MNNEADSDSVNLGSNPSSPANDFLSFDGCAQEQMRDNRSPSAPTDATMATTAAHKARHRNVRICSIDEFKPQVLHLTQDHEQKAADHGVAVNTAYIYVVEAIGLDLFKIGLSVDFAARFPSYRTECPVACRPLIVAIVPKGRVEEIEKALHSHYQGVRAKGEWFALRPADIAHLPDVIKDATRRPLKALDREIKRNGRYRYDTKRVTRERQWQIEAERAQLANAVPTDDLVLDAIAYHKDIGEGCTVWHLNRTIDRRPHDIHEALRYLLVNGEVALVSPLRHPDSGNIWLDAYRKSKLIIPDETCAWEATNCGYEIQVSEPLGRFVPEFFGLKRPY